MAGYEKPRPRRRLVQAIVDSPIPEIYPEYMSEPLYQRNIRDAENNLRKNGTPSRYDSPDYSRRTLLGSTHIEGEYDERNNRFRRRGLDAPPEFAPPGVAWRAVASSAAEDSSPMHSDDFTFANANALYDARKKAADRNLRRKRK